jgi:dTDP-4-amino-4,6-dideoxygalactose transaminase
VQVPHREKVQQQLKEHGIETGIHYPIALPLLKAYAYMEHQPNDFPVAAGQMDKLLSLPMYAELTADQIDFVCEKLISAIK